MPMHLKNAPPNADPSFPSHKSCISSVENPVGDNARGFFVAQVGTCGKNKAQVAEHYGYDTDGKVGSDVEPLATKASSSRDVVSGNPGLTVARLLNMLRHAAILTCSLMTPRRFFVFF